MRDCPLNADYGQKKPAGLSFMLLVKQRGSAGMLP